MAVVFSNNGKTTLSANVSSSATSISVSDGSVFPSLGSGEIFFCTLDDGTNNEIVKVTAISSNTLTVVRAQESTTARAFSAGDAAELRLTAGILGLFSQTGVAITDEVEAYLDGGNSTPSFASITSGAISASDHIRIVDNKKLLMGSGDMFQIGHITDHSQIVTYEGDLYIDQNADDKDIIFRSDNGSGGITTYLTIDGSITKTVFNKDSKHNDGIKAHFGTNDDLRIQHTGSTGYVANYTGTLSIQNNTDDGDVVIQSDNGSGSLANYFMADGSSGSANLYHYGSLKLNTTSGGVSVSGDITIKDGTTNKQSTDMLYIGGDGLNGSDAAIYIGNQGNGSGVGWRLFYEGSGSGNNNKLIIKSENQNNPVDALSFTQDGNATFSGNIAVSGTVDGRDVATDGSKLDGIESGATADQTASEILTAIKTVDGSGSGLDADTVDGFQASSFLRSDANDTATGALTIGGAVYGSYGSGSTDITGLINGSTFGSMITATGSGHHVIGLKDNDNNDSFAVISGSGNYTTDSTYDKLVFRAQANGTVTVGGGNLAVTGNITLTGTVDGRDIATDGSKLDGIESGATADQTASEILTAINTVDGSGSGLDADLLDGQHGSHYLNYNNFTNTPTIPTNNNQLTNGAGYTTNTGTVSSLSDLSITSTAAELNVLDGYTGSVTELNYLDTLHATGVTATEFDYLDGVTSNIQTQLNSKLSSFDITTQTDPKYLRSDTADTASGTITFSANTLIAEQKYIGYSSTYNYKPRVTGGIGTRSEIIGAANILIHGDTDGSGTGEFVSIRAGAGTANELKIVSKTSSASQSSSALVFNGGQVWHAGNDGSSSGLDADLLDGQHGSHYLDYNNFTNTPTIPSLSGYATESYVNTQVSNLVDSAPGTLNTLNELAAALGDDANFSTTITNSIAGKLSLTGGTLSGNLAFSDDGEGISFYGGESIKKTSGTGIVITALSTRSLDTLLQIDRGSGGTRYSVYHEGYHPEADTLTTPRTIAGTSFDGSANIDISYDNLTNKPTNIANSDTVDNLHASSFIRSDATDTASETITFSKGINVGDLSNGGITGSNYNITGVNNITMNDPGEGISFAGTSNVTLYAIDDSTDSIMNFSNASELRVNNNKVWTVSNDGAGSGLDADTLDGTQASGFHTVTSSANNAGNGNLSIGYDSTNLYSYVQSHGSKPLRLNPVGNAVQIGSGNTVWHAGNDGSGSGLDADTLDGINSTSFLRSDAGDTSSATYTFTRTSTTPVFSITGHAGASNYNYFLRAGNDTYTTAAVHFVNGSTRTADHGANAYVIRNDNGTFVLGKTSQSTKIYGTGDLTYNDNEVWHAGNDGSGSSLDADLLDGQHGSYYRNASNINAGTINTARLPTDMILSGGAPRYRLTETGVTNTPSWWHVADSGNYSIRLNNTGAYPIQILTDSDNDAVTNIELNYTVDLGGNKLQLGSEATSYIQSTQAQGTDVFRFTTEDGYIQIGAENTSWAHFITDRPSFYFNTKVTVASHVEPYTDSSYNLGANGLRWANAYVDNLIITNDGSGSAIDSDLLDGQHGSYYLNYNNFTNTPTIPTNNNQLTNGAGYITSFDITTQTDPKYLRSNVNDTTSGNITITKTSPTLTLLDNNTSTGSFPGIEFETSNSQGVRLEHNEFDGELPAAGYGLVLRESSSNTQFPNTGTLSLNVLGEIYAGATSLGSLQRVFHNGYHPNADKLTTARTIAGSSFDGTANISIDYNNLTNLPTIPSLSGYATESYVNTQVSNLVDSAPGTLNTLNELAAALGDDANFSTTVTNSIATKLPLSGGTLTGGLTISGSVDSGGTDYGYYQSAGTNIILKGDSNGRSGIFFESEKNGTNINDPSDYGFIQYHPYGYGGTSGEHADMVIGIANDSPDHLILQSPYNGGVKVGYRDATSGTGLTTQTVFHDAYHPNADTLTTARTIAGTSFNGSANIDISYNNLTNKPTIPTNNNQLTNGAGYVTASTSSLTNYLVKGGSWGAANMPGSRWNGFSVNGGEVAFLRDNPNTSQMSVLADGNFYAGENNGFYSLYSGNSYNSKVGFYGNSSGHFYITTTNVKANGNTIWHAGNDGSGSGLDADLLDGTQLSSIYTNSAVANTSVNKLYENGTITYGGSYLQWTDLSGTGGAGTNGNAPGNPFSDWHHHLIMNHANSGGYYVDMAFSFHNNRVHFRRNQNGSLSSWYEFWHTGNDGSGSGLDADLLDGQHGSYYAPTANPTFTGTVTGTQFKWNVDSAGHNYLGTDIYDALVLHSRPGETIIYGSGETSSSVKAHRFMSSTTNNTTGLGNEVFSITAGGSAALSGTSFTAGGNTVWHAGNDGSGSGLDADTVDGIDIDAINTQGAIAYSSSSTQITGTTQQKVHQGTYGQRMTFTMGGPSGSAQNFGNIGDNSSVVGGNSDDFTIAAGADLVLGQGGYARLRFDGSTAHFFTPVKLGGVLQDNSGNTRISTTGRMYPLDVSVGSSPSKNMEYASSTLTVGSVDDDDFYLNLKGFGGNSNIYMDDGDIYVNGTSNSTAAYKFASNGHFHSNGDVIAYSSTLTTSDRRLKENIVPLDSSLDKINKLQGVKYDWKNKDKGTNQLGLIAQEVEKVVPEVVKEIKDGLGDISGMKVVNYTALVPVLIEAIKEQQKELEYMKAEIKTLKGEK